MLENVSRGEIYTRMCVVYGAQNVLQNERELMGTIQSRMTSTSNQPRSGIMFENKNSEWYATATNRLIDRYKKYLAWYGDYVEKWVINLESKFFLVWGPFTDFL